MSNECTAFCFLPLPSAFCPLEFIPCSSQRINVSLPWWLPAQISSTEFRGFSRMKHCPSCNFSFSDFHQVCVFDGLSRCHAAVRIRRESSTFAWFAFSGRRRFRPNTRGGQTTRVGGRAHCQQLSGTIRLCTPVASHDTASHPDAAVP